MTTPGDADGRWPSAERVRHTYPNVPRHDTTAFDGRCRTEAEFLPDGRNCGAAPFDPITSQVGIGSARRWTARPCGHRRAPIARNSGRTAPSARSNPPWGVGVLETIEQNRTHQR
jgi:hypothetical protein